MKNLKPEMIEKAKAAKSAEELLALAKANGVEMTADEAATCFAQLNPKSGELDDDDLDAVAGGASGCGKQINNGTMVRVINGNKCPNCGGTEGVFFNAAYNNPFLVGCTGCNNGSTHRTITMSWIGLELGVDIELI